MENQIFGVSAGMAKSIVIKNNELWLHGNKVKSIEKFEQAINSPGGMLKTGAYKIPFSSISQVSFNESSESTQIKYTNEKSKEKKLNINFGSNTLSSKFGNFLGSTLSFNKTTTQEGQLKPLLLNGLFLLVAIGGTFFLGTMDDSNELINDSSRKSRNIGVILKLIVDTIGQTGVFIIGGLIALYFAYQLFNRFKNPSYEILYTR